MKALLLLLLSSIALANGETVSPHMGLIIPGVGITDGPQWASDMNASLNIIDQHDHTAGNGVLITPAAMNINNNLQFFSNSATQVGSVVFQALANAPTGSSNHGAIYDYFGDLYYNDGSGNMVRITQNGGVPGSTGTISNLPSGTASASYSSGSGTFVFQQATSTGANIDGAAYILRYPGSYPSISGNYIALEAPTSLATGYSVVFPPSGPSSSGAFLTEATNGSLSYTNIDGTTLAISAAVLGVKTGGIGSTQIAAGAVGSTQIANGAVGATQIASGGVGFSQIASGAVTGSAISTNVSLPGTAAQEAGKNLVVSSVNATTSLAVVRGCINTDGTIILGEGFTSAKNSTGSYTATFTNTYSDGPSVVASITGSTNRYFVATTISAGSVTFTVYDTSGIDRDNQICFISMGQR